MIISPTEKYLFIHIPKTAGISLSQGMLKYTGVGAKLVTDTQGVEHSVHTHTDALTMKRILGEQYKRYHTFSVVRNPWDRLVSLYHFKLQSAQDRLSGVRRPKAGVSRENDMEEIAYLSRLGFKSWLLNGKCDCHLYSDSLTRLSQKSWLVDENGELIVNQVLKFETLDEDLKTLRGRINIDYEARDTNKSNRLEWINYYDLESFHYVNEVFKDDIEAFDYRVRWKDSHSNSCLINGERNFL